jgi:hypothetical protein
MQNWRNTNNLSLILVKQKSSLLPEKVIRLILKFPLLFWYFAHTFFLTLKYTPNGMFIIFSRHKFF